MTNQKVAVITGGGNGIGSSIVEAFVHDGYTTVIADINEEGSLLLQDRLRAQGGTVDFHKLDVGSEEQIAGLFEYLDRQYGRCDVLVNNAGIAKTIPYLEYPKEHWDLVMRVNVTGPFLLSQYAGRLMKKNGWGRIINLASISGEIASFGRAAYGTSKAAVYGLTRQMAIELSEYGITANGISPGPIETPLTQVLHSDEARKAYTDRVPMGRYGSSNEIAAAVLFLASEGASYINGHVLPVDGGFLASGVLQP